MSEHELQLRNQEVSRTVGGESSLGSASLKAPDIHVEANDKTKTGSDPNKPKEKGTYEGQGKITTPSVKGTESKEDNKVNETAKESAASKTEISTDSKENSDKEKFKRWVWKNNSWEKVDFNVTNKELKDIFKSGIAESLKLIEVKINLEGANYGIASKGSLAHFLSQAGHEVGDFTKGLGRTESFNYSVDGLIGTFGKYFYKGKAKKGKKNADNYGRKKGQSAKREQIANIVYSNRMGNGNEQSGDGYKYRGRGIFQLTGKDNYKAFNDFVNVPDVDFLNNPEKVNENEYAILSALWFYKTKVVNKLKDINKATVTQVTEKVNGGKNGLDDRKNIHKRATKELN